MDYHQPSDVDHRLDALGLSREILIEALNLANIYRVRTTDHHPRLYRYQIMSAETIAALRDLLIPSGWEKKDDGNYELTVNPVSNVAIMVASGDRATADLSSQPSNKSPKGWHTVHAIEVNRQADLFEELLPNKNTMPPANLHTWVLLHCVTDKGIKCELSKPYDIGEDGKINAWSERIIIGIIPFNDDPVIDIDPNPDMPDIDIEITRKTI